MPKKTFAQLRKQEQGFRRNLLDTLKWYFKVLEYTRKDYPFFLDFTEDFAHPGDMSCVDAFRGLIAMSPNDLRLVHTVEDGSGHEWKAEVVSIDSLYEAVKTIGLRKFDKRDMFAFAKLYPEFVYYNAEYSKYAVKKEDDDDDEE